MIRVVRSGGNRSSLIYVVAVFLLWIKMCVLYRWVFHVSTQTFGESLLLAVVSLSSAALILGTGFFAKQKNRPLILFIIHLILTGILYGNVLYYRFYIDFVTVPILFQFKNVGGLGQSTIELLKIYDISFFVDCLILFILIKYKWAIKTSFQFTKRMGFRVLAPIMVVPLLITGIVNAGFWNKSYDKELIVQSLGLYYYHIFDIYENSRSSIKRVMADGSEVKKIEHYLQKRNENVKPSNLHGIAKGKNVIVIFLESTQGFVIDHRIDDQEVTPFLNQLKSESLYFPNFYHQTAQGKTSDAEFILDNSLYPLSGGSLFVRKPNNKYYAMPTILKEHQYYSATFHGNDAYFWNREKAYEAMGYDRFFSKDDFNVTEENSINYGLKDIPFFEQSLPYLNELPEPFYAKFLTLTNHFPFLLEPEDQWIEEAKTDQGLVNRYFTTVRYEDEAIKTFFEQIKETELYENSIFVLFGDHYGISTSYNEALEEVLGHEITINDEMELQKVPLFIHIPGVTGMTIDAVGGQVDLRTTIFDLLGIEEPKGSLSFGTSLLANKEDRVVAFRDGSFTTKDYTFVENTCYNKETGKRVKRNYCTPYFEKVQTELNYSDQIIFGDLFRFLENDK